jgi:NADPH:quinone reductase-like Zn-dependent oxidoreductase
MAEYTTEAWVLYAGRESIGSHHVEPASLSQELFSFSELAEGEVLAEPLYGCWEANMSHAIERRPIDICRYRGEEKVVLGNAGVVRVLKTESSAAGMKEGDICMVYCNGIPDRFGFPERILAYDTSGSIGVLAKRMKLRANQLIPIPPNTRHSLEQWAAFSLRYVTAWANWKQAYGCWALNDFEAENAAPAVWGWGGGVSFAELTLAKFLNCQSVMISSQEERLKTIENSGIRAIDRRQFPNLSFNDEKYRIDRKYRELYQESEDIFLETVKEATHDLGVSIFIDYIGAPVLRVTLKALSRRGVITTAGWKLGMNVSTIRALECMNWHTHVHTHYARYAEAVEAVRFAEDHGWMPAVGTPTYGWHEIPRLARDYFDGKIGSYFPIFQINTV